MRRSFPLAPMVLRRDGGCLTALALLACACATGAAAPPSPRLRPAFALRRAGGPNGHGALYRPLRLKGGGRLNLDKREKTDVEMAEAAALNVELQKFISKNRPIAQEASRYNVV